MPTTIDSAGITFNDATSLTSAVLAANSVGATQIANGSVTAAKLGTTEQTRIAKAWVNFDGTLATPITPRASYNVSSVTKNGTGDYTVNFATAMADANYSLNISTSRDGSPQGNIVNSPVIETLGTSSCRVITYAYGSYNYGDHIINGVNIFGN
jgi:hypothetical protein